MYIFRFHYIIFGVVSGVEPQAHTRAHIAPSVRSHTESEPEHIENLLVQKGQLHLSNSII